MREILFRGKSVDNGEWVYGYYYKTIFNSKLLCCIYNDRGVFYVIPETVGQYTGLTDKNGKKIFEGDSVRYCDKGRYWPEEDVEFLGEICFEKGAFGIGSHKEIPPILEEGWRNDNFVPLWEIYWNLNCTNNTLHMLEVVGNIHDNSELLGEVESCKQ